MINRRRFLAASAAATAGKLILPSRLLRAAVPRIHGVENIGVQLYTFRDAMMNDAPGTLKVIAELGFKEIESAGSEKGYYYGLSSVEMKQACEGLGMVLRSGHVSLDDNFERTMDDAAAAGQEYVICSSMPTWGQTVDNYRATADAFNAAGEQCNSRGLKFGYHNHQYEFDEVDGQVLFDILMDNTDPELVYMQLDLGWVIVGGKDPLDYFERYPGRFPTWHLKDMDVEAGHSTEFGKGDLDIAAMLANREASGVKHIFVEQEEYAVGPAEAMAHDLEYLRELRN